MAREASTYQSPVEPAVQTSNGPQPGTVKKAKRPRSPSPPRPAFFIVQVLDENGQPIQFDKRRIKIVSVERDAEKVLETVESGSHEHAFYLRGIVPPGRAFGPRTPAASA